MESPARLHLHRLLLLCGFTFILCGCRLGGIVTPPAHVESPATVFLKLDARHSGIAFPVGAGRFREYSFGAWRWFAVPDTRWPVALGSLGGVMQSTLQTNEYPSNNGVPLTRYDAEFIPIAVDARRADALRMELDARFARQFATYRYNELYDMHFVQDHEHYWMFNNCYQVTGRWLRRLGCRVDGLTLTNDFRLDKQ